MVGRKILLCLKSLKKKKKNRERHGEDEEEGITVNKTMFACIRRVTSLKLKCPISLD